MKARAETLKFMADPKNFDRVIEIFAKYSALEKATLVTMVKNNIDSFSPMFRCQAIANVTKFNIDAGVLPADKAPACKDFIWSGAAQYVTQ
jgi:hypothetical protein